MLNNIKKTVLTKTLMTEVFGLTTPVLVTANGQKFGKSEGNALWLDAEKTSRNDIYQYIINLSDGDALLYLRMLTFLELEEIADVVIIKKNKKKNSFCLYLFLYFF